ncbi:MAG: hypothetical protein HDT14_05755 [Oscillibacter sp.]|nr:hypothetical protein [Oscillibacter sp.]
MTLFWSIILWGCMIWLVPVMYFMLKNECKPKKNIIVGVTLPYEAQQDEAVLALLERYKKEMKITCLASLAAVVPGLFISDVGIAMTALMLWTVAICLVFFIPYVRCNMALQKLKAERGWRRDAEDASQAVTDLKAAAAEMRWLSPWWFLPPFIISLIPLFFDRSIWGLWMFDAAMVPICYLCYRYLYRSRAEVVDENSQRTIALTQIRRYNWGKCWVVAAWATGFLNVGMWLTSEHIWLCMAVILVYGLAVSMAVIGIEFRVRRLQEKLTADSGRGYYVDEDDHWIWGMMYYNPNDTRLLVNARIGINSTFNMARRSGQVIMGLILAVLLACPLAGVWMIGMEHAPVELEVTETELVGSHYGGHWSVALADIAEAEIIEELPRLTRTMGTGLSTACTGQFSSGEWGRVTLCINPQAGPWLLVKDSNGKLFLFGASEEGAVEKIAASLTAAGAWPQGGRAIP